MFQPGKEVVQRHRFGQRRQAVELLFQLRFSIHEPLFQRPLTKFCLSSGPGYLLDAVKKLRCSRVRMPILNMVSSASLRHEFWGEASAPQRRKPKVRWRKSDTRTQGPSAGCCLYGHALPSCIPPAQARHESGIPVSHCIDCSGLSGFPARGLPFPPPILTRLGERPLGPRPAPAVSAPGPFAVGKAFSSTPYMLTPFIVRSARPKVNRIPVAWTKIQSNRQLRGRFLYIGQNQEGNDSLKRFLKWGFSFCIFMYIIL